MTTVKCSKENLTVSNGGVTTLSLILVFRNARQFHLQENIDLDYEIINIIVKKYSSVKDFGVILGNELSFRQHFETKVAESLKSYCFIVRNCRNLIIVVLCVS